MSITKFSKALDIIDSTCSKKIVSMSVMYDSLEIAAFISPEKDHSLNPRFISFISKRLSKSYLEIRYSLGEDKILESDNILWSAKSKTGISKKIPL